VTEQTTPTATPAREHPVPVLEARCLTKVYASSRRRAGVRTVAVDGVDLKLFPGTVTALVGQSGSGKSTTAKLLARLERPDSGEILLDGRSVPRRIRVGYRRAVQIVFQDPFASLNPAHTIGYHLSRPLRLHGHARTRPEVRDASISLLRQVNLHPAAAYLRKLPHELSGGQRQRVAIALALAVGPRVLLADEPVSMLDVSIRLGILNLLRDLARERKLALLYITHDIAFARYFADTVAVVYAGRVVERGPAEAVVADPAHPYTRLLLAAAPQGGQRRGELPPLPQRRGGTDETGGERCLFAPRCPHAIDRCTSERPAEVLVAKDWTAACVLHAEGNEPAGPPGPSED
jgi:peptide/nickel transport system ATP-binding protein